MMKTFSKNFCLQRLGDLGFRTTSFNSEDAQSELSVFIVLLSLIRRSLPSDDFFRTSSPWKLETFSQNILSSGFSGTWFIRVDVDSRRLLLLPGSFLPCSSGLQCLVC